MVAQRYMLASLVSLLLAEAALAASNDASDAFKRLANTRSFKCNYSTAAQTEWKGDKPQTQLLHAQKMALVFDSIDFNQGKGRIIGNQGAGDVSVFLTPSGAQIVEQTAVGNVMLTTIFAEYVPGTREFASVSSRHVSIFGPVPSQWYGSCQVWE